LLSAIATMLAVGATFTAREVRADDDRLSKRYKTVLVLSAEDLTRPWVHPFIEGVRDAVQKADPAITIYNEFIDGARFDTPAYAAQLRNWLGQKYRDRKIDLIVVQGRQGVEFLAEGRGQPWPGVPVVWGEAGGLRGDVSHQLAETAGVSYERSLMPFLHVVKTVLPDTKRVALVYGGSALERSRFGGYAAVLRQTDPDLEPIDLGGLAMNDVLQRVARLPEHTIVLNLSVQFDGAGRSFAPLEPCRLIARASNRPLFSLPTHEFGCGVVGGRLRDMGMMGRILGEHAIRYMRGERFGTATIPLERYSVLEFDARQLERWGIDERRLPAGSQIEFRRSTLWRDYRGAVIGTIAAGVLQTLLIAILLYERRRRRLAETETRHHLMTAAHLNRRSAMGELAASIAHELNQPLGAILHNAEAATMALDGGAVNRDELREILDDIRKDDTRAAEIIRRLRALLRNHELELQLLDVNTLARETVELVAATARSKGVQVDLQFDAGSPVVRGDRIHLQQVLLNLLLNSIDAMAICPPAERQLIVRTSRGVDDIGIFVVDAGCGIPADAVSSIFEPFYTTKGQGMGMGLCIARSIVEAHGGHVGARNNHDRGATVWFTLPMAA
jgi:signal transduction histidine kinase